MKLVCSKCKQSKPVSEYRKNKNMVSRQGYSHQCKSCDKLYLRGLEATAINLYHSTVFNSKRRKHGPPTYTKQEFMDWIMNDPEYKRIHAEWVKSDYARGGIPSIDRIKTNQGYTLKNTRVVTWDDNQRLNVIDMSTKVQKLDADGNVIETYDSIRAAARSNSKNSTGSGIATAIENPEKKAYGHYWRALESEAPEEDLLDTLGFDPDEPIEDLAGIALEAGRVTRQKLNMKVFQLEEPASVGTDDVKEKLSSVRRQLLALTTTVPIDGHIPGGTDLIHNPRKQHFMKIVTETATVYAGLKAYIVGFCAQKGKIEAMLNHVLRSSKISDFTKVKKDLNAIKLPLFKATPEYLTPPVDGTRSLVVLSGEKALNVRKGGSQLEMRWKTNVAKRISRRTSSQRKTDASVKVLTLAQIRQALKQYDKMHLRSIKKVAHKNILRKIRDIAKRATAQILRISRQVNGKGDFTQVYYAVNGIYQLSDRLLQDEYQALTPWIVRQLTFVEENLALYR